MELKERRRFLCGGKASYACLFTRVHFRLELSTCKLQLCTMLTILIDGSLMDPMSKGYDKCFQVILTNSWSIFYSLLYGSHIELLRAQALVLWVPSQWGFQVFFPIAKESSFVQYHRTPSCLTLNITALHFPKLLRTRNY